MSCQINGDIVTSREIFQISHGTVVIKFKE